MENKTIEIQNFSFKGTEIIESLPDQLILSEFDIEYRWKLTANITEDSITKQRKYQGSKNILKSKIMSVEAMWDEEKECYCLSVFAHKESMTTAYKTFAEALKVKEQILNWLKS